MCFSFFSGMRNVAEQSIKVSFYLRPTLLLLPAAEEYCERLQRRDLLIFLFFYFYLFFRFIVFLLDYQQNPELVH